MNGIILPGLGAVAIALIAVLGLTPLCIRVAHLFNILDRPNSRKAHRSPIPRTGGLAIALGSILAASTILILRHHAVAGLRSEQVVRLVSLVCASAFILLIGFFDDLWDIPSKYKLCALVFASAILCGAGLKINGIIFGGRVILEFGWASWPATILWVVGVTVSLNFIDGLDGLAAGLGAIACAAFAVGACFTGQLVPTVLALSLFGSLIGFLFFNFHPAKVFMGDAGSMFVGFVLAASCAFASSSISTMAGLVVPALALAIPFVDAALTLIRRRILQRRSVFAAERGHVHHRLLDLGLRHQHVVMILWGVSLASAGVGLIALFGMRWATISGLTLLLPLWAGLFRMAGSVRARETLTALRRNRAMDRENRHYREAFEQMQLRLRSVRGFAAWWQEICRAADMLDFARISLPLTRRDGTNVTLRWVNADQRLAGCASVRARMPLRQRRSTTVTYIKVQVAAPTFLESAGHRISLFARVIAEHSLGEVEDVPGPRGAIIRARRASGDGSRRVPVPPKGGANGAPPAGVPVGAAMANPLGDLTARARGRLLEGGEVDAQVPLPSPVRFPVVIALPVMRSVAEVPPVADNAASGMTADGADDLPQSDPVAPALGADLLDEQGRVPAAKSVADLRIAIVHDFLYTYAGAERVLEQLVELYPQADLFSLFDFLPKGQRKFIKDKPVRCTFIQRLPLARRKHRAYLPLMPMAIEQLDVSAYDVIISSSYVAAKGVLTRPDQLHICYCHSPARFAWDLQNQYLAKSGLVFGIRSFIARVLLHYFRIWDTRTANGVDVFVTNSRFVARRVDKIYRRKSLTIYPPVDTARFTVEEQKEDFYLTVSRMVPYKRMDLIVEAFSQMPERRLLVVGDGPDFDKLRAKAGPNVKLMGHQPAERLIQYLQMARAFIFAAEEDFGIAPVEAQACGTPVIAFGRGGATESVVDGRTGVLFHEQSVESLIRAVRRFEQIGHWDAHAIRANAQRFSPESFRGQFARLLEREWAAFKFATVCGLSVSMPDRRQLDVAPGERVTQAVSPAATEASHAR